MLITVRYIFIVLLLIMAAACGTSRKTPDSLPKVRTARALVDHMVRQQLNVEWFAARAKIDYEDNERGVSASATIKMKKDSVIWISIRKLGFEVARVQADQDSVYLINRLNNEYMVKELEYLAEEYQLPADLRTLQSVLLGNPIFFQLKDLELETVDDKYRLSGQSNQWKNQFWLDSQNLLLLMMNYEDLRRRRQLDIRMEDYRDVDAGQKFSYLRQISVDSRELGSVEVSIDFSDVDINVPQEIRFSIPSRYLRVD